jgi:cytoskeletal protein CcmA (bactofilin family)
VEGDLHIKRLQVELGARFNGNCHMLEDAEFEKITGTAPAPVAPKK